MLTYRKENGRGTKEDLEKLGREISQTCLWAGDDILTVFKSALEDANFHSFNEKFNELWNEQSDDDYEWQDD